MHAFPGVFGKQREVDPRTNVAMAATTIAAGGTIGVYTTTPVQFVASTAFDISMIRVWNTTACSNSAARGDVVIDIMVGAGGSETSIATFIFGGRPVYSSYTIPIFIPAGSRLSGRVAAGVASRSLGWALDYYGGNNRDMSGLPTRWVPYGLTVSSGTGAYGTDITAGSTNAWSAWTSIIASTTYAHSLWLPMYGVGTQTTITAVNYRSQFAAASTTDAATMVTNGTGIAEGIMLTGNTTEAVGQFNVSTNPVHIGSSDIMYAPRSNAAAFSARWMCSGTATAGTTTAAVLGAVA